MKDYCIDWIENHAVEDDDGTMWLEDSNGEPIGDRKFPKGQEKEFETFCWEVALDT